jgi:cbb3-type cytochrome oxidase subunit 3
MSPPPPSPTPTDPPANPAVPRKKRVSRWFWVALVLPAVALELTSLFSGKHHAVPADARAQQLERAGIWLAWSMAGLMLFLGLFIGGLVWRFRRRSRNPDPAALLLDELYQKSLAENSGRVATQDTQEASPPSQIETADSQTPEWEKQGDWWRKE